MRIEERSALLKSIGESKTGLSALKHGMLLASDAIGKIRRGERVPDAELALYESGFATGGASVDDYVAMMDAFRRFVEAAPADVPDDNADVLVAEKPDVMAAVVALLAQVEGILANSQHSFASASALMATLASGQTLPRHEYEQRQSAFAELATHASEAVGEVGTVRGVLAGHVR